MKGNCRDETSRTCSCGKKPKIHNCNIFSDSQHQSTEVLVNTLRHESIEELDY